jgi:hypothetical protein
MPRKKDLYAGDYLERRRRNFLGARHGNFHFDEFGDITTLKKEGMLLLHLSNLETVCHLLQIKALQERKDENYYWRQFNAAIQKMIDDKVNELDL